MTLEEYEALLDVYRGQVEMYALRAQLFADRSACNDFSNKTQSSNNQQLDSELNGSVERPPQR